MKTIPKFAIAALVALALPASAVAAEPALTVPQATLDAAIHCHGPALQGTKLTPIMLVTGTGASGEDAYAIGKDAFDLYGHPVCDVNFPYNTTANIQTSVQYLVNGIRYEYAQSGRKLAVFGISQGGFEMGISTIAATVRDQSAQVVAAVSITVPSQKIDPTSLDTLVADIQGAALELSALLGYRPLERSALTRASSALCAA